MRTHSVGNGKRSRCFGANRSIGTAAAGGMFIGTFVGIFLVPGLYLIFESWSAHLNRNKVSYDEEDEK